MANQFASSALTATVGLLKNWYAGTIVDLFNEAIPLYKHMENGREKAAGLQVIRAVKARRNQSVGWTTDGGTLPASGVQTTLQAQIAYKYGYLVFGLTGPMLAASKGDKAAFGSIMEVEMQGGLDDFKNDFNRQLFWNGDGTLATVSANATSSNVITVTGRESTEDGNLFLDVGMVIDVINSSGVAVASGVSITALSGTTTATLTLSAAVTVSANDIVVRSGDYNNEVQGLLYTMGATQTGTIYNINRSTYPQFQSNVLNASGGQLTLDLMQQAYNAGMKRGGAKYDALFCDFDSERFYNKLLVADRRYVPKGPGDGTFSSKEGSYLEYAGLKVIPDKDAPRRFFFLDSKTWKKYELGEPLHWCDESGSLMIPQISADAWQVRLRHMCNVFCEKPAANAVLRNYVSP